MRRLDERMLKRVLWLLLLLNMAAVFGLSAQPAEVSTNETDAVIALPKQVFDAARPELANDFRYVKLFRFVVRKTAHFMEFATLSVWAGWLLALYGKPRPFLLGAVFSAFYAATDELHQMLVPGREGKISDWLIDASGAIVGALVIWLLFCCWQKRRTTSPENGEEAQERQMAENSRS